MRTTPGPEGVPGRSRFQGRKAPTHPSGPQTAHFNSQLLRGAPETNAVGEITEGETCITAFYYDLAQTFQTFITDVPTMFIKESKRIDPGSNKSPLHAEFG